MTMKSQVTDLAARLRDAAKLQEPHAMAAIKLLDLYIERLKDELVTAQGDELLRTQGAARQLQRIHRELTVTPPSITKPTE